MNGIGITEWRDQGLSSSYPLERNVLGDDLFTDASFVQFDNFIPVLDTIDVQTNSVIFTFLVDDGELTYTLAAENCIEGYVIYLRRSNRAIGTLICGPGISTLFSNNKGLSFNLSTNFLPVTVRSVPSSAGLYALHGLTEAVNIEIDAAQELVVAEGTPNVVTWNAVSKPSRVEQFALSPTKLYAVTNRKTLVELDPEKGTATTVLTLPEVYSAITVHNNILYGVVGTSLYSLNILPPTKICTVPAGIIGLATDNSTGRLMGITPTQLIVFTSNFVGAPTTFTIPTTLRIGSGLLGTDTQFNVLATSVGPFDNRQEFQHKMSDIFYALAPEEGADPDEVVSALRGLLLVDGDSHQDRISGMARLGDDVYVVTTDQIEPDASTPYNKLIKVNVTLATGELLISVPNDIVYGSFVSLTHGANIAITLQKVTPLKHLNGVGPVDNAVQIRGGGLIQVQQSNFDELTVNLAVDTDLTKIKRSTKYE